MDADTLSELKYLELQALAKKHGIKANGGKEYLVQELANYFEEQQAPSGSRRTRSASKSAGRVAEEDRTHDASARDSTNPSVRRTRSGHLSRTASGASGPPGGSVQRTRSRVISSVAPRAALVRTPSRSKPKRVQPIDSSTEQEASTPPPPTFAKKKALDSQRRLGVGRPKAIGGSGVRKSTAVAKPGPSETGRIVEVLVPTLQVLREEEAAAASRASPAKQPSQVQIPVDDDDDDEGDNPSTPPPPRLKPSKPRVEDKAILMRLSALEDRMKRTESALATKTSLVEALNTRIDKLESDNERLRVDLEALQRQDDSQSSKQIISETPQSPSSREQTPIISTHRISGAGTTASPGIQTSQTITSQPVKIPSASPERLEEQNQNPEADSSIPANQDSEMIVTHPSTTRSPQRRQQSPRVSPHIRPRSPTPSPQTLGKHPRDTADSSEAVGEDGVQLVPTKGTPTKRRRVDEQPAVAEDTDMDGVAVYLDGEEHHAVPTVLSVPVQPTTATRASSQPPRPRRTGRATARASVEPVLPGRGSRRTRAGSAAPAVSSYHLASTSTTTQLQTVTEGEDATTSSSTGGHISLAPIDPLPLPRTHDASIPKFISYPLPGDPVKELQPLTHFDSGTEFFGTRSKQNYRTDWHEGTVFDDPFDAETVRRAQGIAAEEGHGGFGPQGLPGIADELEERDEEESLGMRGMMSYPGEDGDLIHLTAGL